MAPTIRLATPADAGRVRDIYAPFVRETPVSFEETPPSTEGTRDRIDARLERYPWLVCEGGGEVAGFAAAGELRSTPAYDWTVELSVYVAEDHRRAGAGRGLYESLLAALERQGYRSAYAAVTLPNPASERLHEAAGFEPVGDFPNAGHTQGEWRNVRWWYRAIGEHSPDPDPPLSLDAARGKPGWHDALAAGEPYVDPR